MVFFSKVRSSNICLLNVAMRILELLVKDTEYMIYDEKGKKGSLLVGSILNEDQQFNIKEMHWISSSEKRNSWGGSEIKIDQGSRSLLTVLTLTLFLT